MMTMTRAHCVSDDDDPNLIYRDICMYVCRKILVPKFNKSTNFTLLFPPKLDFILMKDY